MTKNQLLEIIELSPLLKDKAARHPEWVDEALPDIGRRLTRPELDSSLAQMAGVDPSEAQFMQAIRRFKYKNLLRIAAADFHSLRPVAEILAEWSELAGAIIDATYKYASSALGLKFGHPSQCTGSVIALGKLGGLELNISSDVDLIFIYSTDEGISPGMKISNHEFFVNLASLMTRLLSTITEDGFAFRVDHDLRPEGAAGALANSLAAAIRYYENFGRDWERQAFIRARPVAGDISLGDKLIAELRPFVYRRSISIADISHMREIKNRMEKETFRSTKSRDIKHGPGGIREAEFLVQALLSLHGGANPDIRKSNTFEAIAALERKNLIHPHGAKLLKVAYSFLRRLENMIQIAEDVQTHTLPHGGDALANLAKMMGHCGDDSSAVAALEAEITDCSRTVEILFHALFEEDYDRKELEEALADNLSRAKDEEEEADSLAWFVRGENLRLARLDLEGKIELMALLERLTITAEVALGFACKVSEKALEKRFGKPLLKDGGAAGFAVIGMGKLGSSELDYGSDLDLCFLYSGEGETSGPARIFNVEYFTKLAQRIITLISLPTRYGRAYMIDSELRPSGRQGALVATLESFTQYHRKEAAVWERLALLKARAIAGGGDLAQAANAAISALRREIPPPGPKFAAEEIVRLREKTLAERTQDAANRINIKLGRGGISDLESAIQFYQLQNISRCDGLNKQNTFDVLDALFSANIINGDLYDALASALAFYRKLLSRARLVTASSTDIIDSRAPSFADIATQMGMENPAQMLAEIERTRAEVEEIYGGIFFTRRLK